AAARALTYNALRLFHEGQDCIREVSMAKLLTQRAVLEIADQSLQIHGGYGYMREYGIERAVRDARLGPIGGGTDEIMRDVMGKGIGLWGPPYRAPASALVVGVRSSALDRILNAFGIPPVSSGNCRSRTWLTRLTIRNRILRQELPSQTSLPIQQAGSIG